MLGKLRMGNVLCALCSVSYWSVCACILYVTLCRQCCLCPGVSSVKVCKSLAFL